MPSYADNISASYVGLSTVEDLSYTPSADEQSRDVAQIAATGRRSWKTLKGKGEAVWPPNLYVTYIADQVKDLTMYNREAALIEGEPAVVPVRRRWYSSSPRSPPEIQTKSGTSLFQIPRTFPHAQPFYFRLYF